LKLASLSRGRTGCLAQSANRLCDPPWSCRDPEQDYRRQRPSHQKPSWSGEESEQDYSRQAAFEPPLFLHLCWKVWWRLLSSLDIGRRGRCCVGGWLAFLVPWSQGSIRLMIEFFLHIHFHETYHEAATETIATATTTVSQ